MAVKRKLTSPTDPTPGGSNKKGPKAATAPKVNKAKGGKVELSEADKAFNNERAAHLRKKRKNAAGQRTGASVQKRLERRLAAFGKRVAKVKDRLALKRRLLAARFKTVNGNLKKLQGWRRGNMVAKQKLYLKWVASRKPRIVNGKIVSPKSARPKFKAGKKPTMSLMPRLIKGKIVTKKRRPPKREAGASAAAKKGAKTKKSGAATNVAA